MRNVRKKKLNKERNKEKIEKERNESEEREEGVIVKKQKDI